VLTVSATAAAEPRLGLMADLGAPDGANASIVYRPVRAIRMHGGVGHNYVSRGVRGGITLVPFATSVTPTVSFDYGRYFEGDANPLARMISGDPMFSSSLLDSVGYDYANVHAGVEVGRKWVTFYVHAGMSRITSDLKNLSSESSTVTFSDDPTLTMWTVSARLGFIFYLVK